MDGNVTGGHVMRSCAECHGSCCLQDTVVTPVTFCIMNTSEETKQACLWCYVDFAFINVLEYFAVHNC